MSMRILYNSFDQVVCVGSNEDIEKLIPLLGRGEYWEKGEELFTATELLKYYQKGIRHYSVYVSKGEVTATETIPRKGEVNKTGIRGGDWFADVFAASKADAMSKALKLYDKENGCIK